MGSLGKIWIAALAAALLGGCGGTAPAPAAPPQPADKSIAPAPDPAAVMAAARGLVEQYRQAYEVRSVEALDPLYADSPDLILVRQGRSTRGWQAARSRLSALMSRADEIQLRIRDLVLMPLGADGVAITARVSRTIHEGATATRENGVLTLTLGRQGQRWVIVSEHFSYPRRAP